MFRDSYQRGMLTVFYSCGSKPLALWDVFTKNGYVSKFMDPDIKSTVFEIGGANVSTTYMLCPKGKTVLGITMPFLVMIVKNLRKYFSFEVTALDDTGQKRRFRVSNFQSTTQIMPLSTVMPIGLTDGWNQIQFNLAEFMRRAYRTQFVEVLKLKINANIRLRRIYFTERLLPEDQLPPEFRLFFPLTSKGPKDRKKDPENLPLEHSSSKYPSEEAIDGKVNISKDVIRSSTSTRSKKSLLGNIDKFATSHLKQPTIPEVSILEETPMEHETILLPKVPPIEPEGVVEAEGSAQSAVEAVVGSSAGDVFEVIAKGSVIAKDSAEGVMEAVAKGSFIVKDSAEAVIKAVAKGSAIAKDSAEAVIKAVAKDSVIAKDSAEAVIEAKSKDSVIAKDSAEAVIEAVAKGSVVSKGSAAAIVEISAVDATDTLGDDITEIMTDEVQENFDEIGPEAPIETVRNQSAVKVVNEDIQAVTPEEAPTAVDEF